MNVLIQNVDRDLYYRFRAKLLSDGLVTGKVTKQILEAGMKLRLSEV